MTDPTLIPSSPTITLALAFYLLLTGLMLLALGEVFSAVKEIALNTRAALPKDQQRTQTRYTVLEVMVTLNVIVAALAIGLAILMAYLSLR